MLTIPVVKVQVLFLLLYVICVHVYRLCIGCIPCQKKRTTEIHVYVYIFYSENNM